MNVQGLEVLIKNIRSTNGQFIISVFADDKGFQDEKPIVLKHFKK
jgi:uncharacterized protein (DUF2141 family)